MLTLIKSIFARQKIEAISIQVATDMRATHQREIGRLIMRERSGIRARVDQLDRHIATASASLAELKGERDQLEAQYAALALDLSRYGMPGLDMTIPVAGHGGEVA